MKNHVRWAVLVFPMLALAVATAACGDDTGGASSDDDAGGGPHGGDSDPACGNGVIEDGEECDGAGDGCSDTCEMQCGEAGAFEDPVTHHCYFYVEAAPQTWADAKAACEAVDGQTHLATLATLDEWRAVTDAITTPDDTEQMWIGGTDIDVEGTYVWIDGSPWVYAPTGEPWAPTNPSNGDGLNEEDCVTVQSESDLNLINDVPCEDILWKRYLCERDPAGA